MTFPVALLTKNGPSTAAWLLVTGSDAAQQYSFVTQGANGAQTPIDLAAITSVQCEVRSKAGALLATATGSVVDAANGIIQVQIDAAGTSALVPVSPSPADASDLRQIMDQYAGTDADLTSILGPPNFAGVFDVILSDGTTSTRPIVGVVVSWRGVTVPT